MEKYIQRTACKRVSGSTDSDEQGLSRKKRNVNGSHQSITNSKRLSLENLKVDYSILYSKTEANNLFKQLETEVVYNTGTLAQIKIFGKTIDIPRKQAAYGCPGLSYTFSGNTIPAKSWDEFKLLKSIKKDVESSLDNAYNFNFVLINRYESGSDYMGEHQDNEKDLVRHMPIASLSFGQQRDFVFKHKDARGKNKSRTDLKPVTINLQHGSLLVMHHPTNDFWYHSLPKRKKLVFPRINLTFRVMNCLDKK